MDKTNNLPGHWKSRLAIALIMLALTFVGIVLLWVEQIDTDSSWYYWLAIVFIFASLNIGYGIYIRKNNLSHESHRIWQDIMIWVGVIIAHYVIRLVIGEGLMGRLEGGIIIINTMALGVFCSGVLMDVIFVLVGITMFIFAIAMAVLTKYLSIIVVAVGAIAAIAAFYIARRGSGSVKHNT